MKRIFLITVIVLSSIISKAQFSYGVEGGINFTGFAGKRFETTMKNGFQGGIITELQLPILFGIEMDVRYSQKGANIADGKYKLEYLDVPVLFKFYTIKVLSFQFGPQYSYLLNAKYADEKVKENYKSSDFALVAGLGFDLKKLHANIRYNIGLTDVSDDDEGKIRNRGFQISVGYWFSKKDKK